MTTAAITPEAQAAQSGTANALGNALHAIKVFAGAAVSVVLLGQYAEEAHIKR